MALTVESPGFEDSLICNGKTVIGPSEDPGNSLESQSMGSQTVFILVVCSQNVPKCPTGIISKGIHIESGVDQHVVGSRQNSLDT